MRDDYEADDTQTDVADSVDATTDLIAAGLLGAAIGAGLGLLLTRLVPEPPPHVAAWREVRRAGRKTIKRARSYGADTASSVGRAAASASSDVGDRIEEELRNLRRLVRRGRRRGLFG